MPKVLFAAANIVALLLCGTPADAQSDVATNPGLAPPGRYRAVRDHSQVVFAIMHLGLSPYYGRVAGIAGTLSFSPLDPARSTVAIDVDMTTVSVPNDQLSKDLCAAMVFDCAAHPKASFKSTAIVRTGANTGDITGDLTLAGVTRPVTLHATFNGGRPGLLGASGYNLGFSGEATIKRSDFGLNKMIWTTTVADEVKLLIEAEFQQDTP
jgi:polyisoprenoid-binding protein YceI